MHSENADECKKNSEDEPIEGTILAAGFGGENQSGQQEQHERKSAMEPAHF